jgi:hypothetical protein
MLTPAQQRTLEALRRTDDDALVFDAGFIADLRADAKTGITELAARLDERTLPVNKFNIAEVLACERHFLRPATFAWSPAVACGKVSHRAIELLLNWRGEPTPADLVDEALLRSTEDDGSLGEWLRGSAPGATADLRSRAVARVTQFVECFPPLRRTWHPVTEAQVRWPLGGPVTLRAKADIVIGRPAGNESRKVLIDLKSGGISHRHREDLRYYALVETLVREVPPRMVASFSLEAGDAVVEHVTEGLLRSSLRRTLDAVERMIELQVEGRPPRAEPGSGCFRCRAEGAAEGSPAADGVGSADDVDLVADGEVVPDGDRVGRTHADAAR